MTGPNGTNATEPTAAEIYDYFMYEAPWYERALLPIALIGSVGGCAPAQSCMGVGSTECNGEGAHETQITFKEGYVSPEEQEQITYYIRQFEARLRTLNPSLFCQFNGWEITDELNGNWAYYDYCKKTIMTPASLFAHAHEFGHYVSDHYGILNGGVIASETTEWQAISCAENDFSLQNCITTPNNIDRGSEEEFADVSSLITSSPTGPIILHSTNQNRLEQASYAARIVGVPEQTIQEIRDEMLTPPILTEVRGEQNPASFFPSGIESEDYLVSENVPYRQMNQGRFLHRFGDNYFLIVTPNEIEEGRWDPENIPVPPQFDFETPYSVDFHNNQVVLVQNGNMWACETSAGINSEWELVSTHNLLQETGAVRYIDGVPIFLVTSSGRFLVVENDGLEKEGRFPKETVEELQKADQWALVFGDEDIALWLNGLPDSKYGKISQMYQLSYINGRLEFSREFEVPTLSHSTKPFYYNGDWHLFDTINYNYLTETSPILPAISEYTGAPVIFRIGESGEKIEPLKLQYPTDNLFNDVNVSMFSLIPSSLHVSGQRLIGVSQLGSDGDIFFLQRNVISIEIVE